MHVCPNFVLTVFENLNKCPQFVLGIEDRVRVSVAAQATEGKANKELVLYIAKTCGLKKSQVDLATVICSIIVVH